jgi:hypothetical protein
MPATPLRGLCRPIFAESHNDLTDAVRKLTASFDYYFGPLSIVYSTSPPVARRLDSVLIFQCLLNRYSKVTVLMWSNRPRP